MIRPRLEKKSRSLLQSIAVGVASSLLFTTVAAPYAQASFWEERGKSVAETKNERPALQLASAQMGLGAAGGPLLAPEKATDGLAGLADLMGGQASQAKQDEAVREILARRGAREKRELKNGVPLALWEKLSSYGEVERVYSPAGGGLRLADGRLSADQPLIIHVQDVHDVYGVQKNLAGLLRELMHLGVDLVGVEGSEGPMRGIETWRKFPGRESLLDAAGSLMREGILSGVEIAGLARDEEKVEFYGMEEKAPYLEQVGSFKGTLAKSAAAQEWEKGFEKDMADLKARAFSEDLKALDQAKASFDKKAVKLGAWIDFLAHFNPGRAAVALSAYPDVARYAQVFALERTLDFKRVNQEQRALLEEASRKLSKPEMTELLEDSLLYRMGKMGYTEYYGRLRARCRRAGIAVTPVMDKYIAYVSGVESIRHQALFNELQALETHSWEKACGGRKGALWELVQIAQDYRLLKKGLDFELGPQEWALYRSRQAELARLDERLDRFAAKQGLDLPGRRGKTTLEARVGREVLERVGRFNELSLVRNEIFVDKLTQRMRERNSKVAVLVAGGFHSAGLESLLKAKNVGFITIKPKINLGAIPDGYHSLHAFVRDPLPLEELFLPEKVTIHTPQVLGTDPAALGNARAQTDQELLGALAGAFKLRLEGLNHGNVGAKLLEIERFLEEQGIDMRFFNPRFQGDVFSVLARSNGRHLEFLVSKEGGLQGAAAARLKGGQAHQTDEGMDYALVRTRAFSPGVWLTFWWSQLTRYPRSVSISKVKVAVNAITLALGVAVIFLPDIGLGGPLARLFALAVLPAVVVLRGLNSLAFDPSGEHPRIALWSGFIASLLIFTLVALPTDSFYTVYHPDLIWQAKLAALVIGIVLAGFAATFIGLVLTGASLFAKRSRRPGGGASPGNEAASPRSMKVQTPPIAMITALVVTLAVIGGKTAFSLQPGIAALSVSLPTALLGLSALPSYLLLAVPYFIALKIAGNARYTDIRKAFWMDRLPGPIFNPILWLYRQQERIVTTALVSLILGPMLVSFIMLNFNLFTASLFAMLGSVTLLTTYLYKPSVYFTEIRDDFKGGRYWSAISHGIGLTFFTLLGFGFFALSYLGFYNAGLHILPSLGGIASLGAAGAAHPTAHLMTMGVASLSPVAGIFLALAAIFFWVILPRLQERSEYNSADQVFQDMKKLMEDRAGGVSDAALEQFMQTPRFQRLLAQPSRAKNALDRRAMAGILAALVVMRQEGAERTQYRQALARVLQRGVPEARMILDASFAGDQAPAAAARDNASGSILPADLEGLLAAIRDGGIDLSDYLDRVTEAVALARAVLERPGLLREARRLMERGQSDQLMRESQAVAIHWTDASDVNMNPKWGEMLYHVATALNQNPNAVVLVYVPRGDNEDQRRAFDSIARRIQGSIQASYARARVKVQRYEGEIMRTSRMKAQLPRGFKQTLTVLTTDPAKLVDDVYSKDFNLLILQILETGLAPVKSLDQYYDETRQALERVMTAA